MSQDQSSNDGAPPAGRRPRPGESTRPNHPVLKRDELIKSPPPSGPDKPLAKTYVVDREENGSTTDHQSFQDDVPTSPGIKKLERESAQPLADLFDDEDMPTLHYDKPPEPFTEESLMLTPESLDPEDEGNRQDPMSPPGGQEQGGSPQAPWLHTPAPPSGDFEPARPKSRAPMVILMILGGVLIVGVSAVVGAWLVLSSTEPEPADGHVANVSESATQPTAGERQEAAAPSSQHTSGEAASVGVPVPIEQAESTVADAGSSSPRGDTADASLGQEPTEGADAAVTAEAPEEGETSEEVDEGQGHGTETSGGDLASVLSPLTDDVLRCTRREQGYHPRALTLHLVPSAEGRRRLRGISPPTPPRVVGCIARLLEGVTLPQAAGGPDERVDYTFQLR